METAKEFVERLPWMSINGKPDFDQWENHLKHRDALLRADERQKAAERAREYLKTNNAYNGLYAAQQRGINHLCHGERPFLCPRREMMAGGQV